MHYHFKARWNQDRDLYMEAIENHINYLGFILEHHEEDYREHLKRMPYDKKIERKADTE
jgi:hypothetical protein